MVVAMAQLPLFSMMSISMQEGAPVLLFWISQ
jgi:hypothetical protein